MLKGTFFSGATGADCLDTGPLFTFNSTKQKVEKNRVHVLKIRGHQRIVQLNDSAPWPPLHPLCHVEQLI